MDINIASATRPTDATAFFEAICGFCKENKVNCTAGVIAPGPGCNNYGFRLEGDNADTENVANRITMALMPAKWAVIEGDPMLKPAEFYSVL